MVCFQRAPWTRFFPSVSKERASALLAVFLSLILLGVTPRIVSSLRPQGSRCRDSRRPRPPRHVQPASIYRLSDTVQGRRIPAEPRAESFGIEADGGRFSSRSRGQISPRASSELTKPEYLKLFSGPQQRTSLPS
jgi:hypothetical protein